MLFRDILSTPFLKCSTASQILFLDLDFADCSFYSTIQRKGFGLLRSAVVTQSVFPVRKQHLSQCRRRPMIRRKVCTTTEPSGMLFRLLAWFRIQVLSLLQSRRSRSFEAVVTITALPKLLLPRLGLRLWYTDPKALTDLGDRQYKALMVWEDLFYLSTRLPAKALC